ncbi:hypothetical protein [Nocardia asteroides]|uniref:Uncharacterized protein n=1 Tax=Nocardia asteroides NBRC 15531 TaxID=1110697 RepID=U5E9Q6_NOCAS|nr:hypothetical protein [Nocardia asteroides]TLF70315.1 hypothetical protein FEK33_08870 [Nocardia asteroides NBRC 15531]UGT49845.1 hypothetical protein LT345_04365 [Nocardia asteroides]SFM02683.1 hypothetical protein SAMN05444423_1011798 [Nocardia asteroides]VEG37403.1 Uncharacterised protein [Nocardia asteroides]BAO99023.1 hypothetical protein [Nocardia asteroides NBRC 15531]
MNSNTTFDAFAKCVLVNTSMVSASRGVLALQGTGLSGVDTTAVPMTVVHQHTPIRLQDKPSVGWQPAAFEAPAAPAVEIGYAPEFTGAIRLRVHPATVLRSRQKCRTRY